jgi:hypothetical protein
MMLMALGGCRSDAQAPLNAATANDKKEGVDFLVAVNKEHFVLRLVKSEQIEIARARVKSTKPQGIVSGNLVEGDGGFNRDDAAKRKWSWHLDPKSVTFPQLVMEVCDGRPSDVEGNKDHWIKDIKRYCPWGAKIELELPDGAGSTSADWRYRQHFANGGSWDANQDGCKVRWCAGKDRNHKIGWEANGAQRLLNQGHGSVAFVYFGERDYSKATLKPHYFRLPANGQPAHTSSKLEARLTTEDILSCGTSRAISYEAGDPNSGGGLTPTTSVGGGGR